MAALLEDVDNLIAAKACGFERDGLVIDHQNGCFVPTPDLGDQLAPGRNGNRSIIGSQLQGIQPERGHAGISRWRDPQRQFTDIGGNQGAREIGMQNRDHVGARMAPARHDSDGQDHNGQGAQCQAIMGRNIREWPADLHRTDTFCHALAVRLEQGTTLGIVRIAGKAVFDCQQRAVIKPALGFQPSQRGFFVRPGDAAQVTPQHHRNGDDEDKNKRDMEFTGKPGPHTHQGQAQQNGQQRHRAPGAGQQVFPPDRSSRQTNATRDCCRAAGWAGKGLCHYIGSLTPGALMRKASMRRWPWSPCLEYCPGPSLRRGWAGGGLWQNHRHAP